MALTVYHYPKCGTCRSAVKWLQEHGHEVTLIDIKEQPPTAERIRAMQEQSGLDLRKWFNVSGEVYKAMQLKDKLPSMPAEEQIRLLAGNGMLIKRPVVTDGKRVTVGYHEDRYREIWG